MVAHRWLLCNTSIRKARIFFLIMFPFCRHTPTLACCMLLSNIFFFLGFWLNSSIVSECWAVKKPYTDTDTDIENRTNSHYFFCHFLGMNISVFAKIPSEFLTLLMCLDVCGHTAYRDNTPILYDVFGIAFNHFNRCRCVALPSGFIVFGAYLIRISRV